MSDRQEPRLPETSSEPDLSLCEREPIHIPGAIQPHGAVLVARMNGRLVTHASANLATILGCRAEAVLGRSLEEVIGDAGCRMLPTTELGDKVALNQTHFMPGPNGSTLSLHAHRTGAHLCIDIEPIDLEPGQRPSNTTAQSVLETFQNAANRAELCELAVRGLKAITGYDRVMAYRFHEDGHGEVIAEARVAHLEPYLGLHYPATDIPAQARQLYLRQRVGSIADATYLPVPLLADPILGDDGLLDLTHSALRSVSPIHRAYMRNMNTAASLTIGLAHRQKLWGMLVCHHSTPRIPGAEVRAAADTIGQVVSLLLSPLGQSEAYERRFELSDVFQSLVEKLAHPVPLIDAFAQAEVELMKLVRAEGAIVRLSGTLLCLGRGPSRPAAQAALSVLYEAAAGEVLAVEDLGLRYPSLAPCTAEGSGVLLLPLSQSTDDVIIWFRPELLQNIVWGGNPIKAAQADPVTGRLSPRESFAAWKEIVRGHSEPWREADLALARELRGAIEAEVAQRTKAELAKLRNYDSLTGLPNRRLLQDRLESDAHPERTALLFLDLDRFKAVNDTMGHAAGDALLVQVAERLVLTAGSENLVVRLGGDEFVVLCQGQEREAISALGERIRLAVEAPFEITGRPCHISVSFGIACADELSGLDLLRAADMAMYAAKKCGGNRGMVFEQSLYDRAARQFELEHDLRDALAHDDQLVLVYQPIFSVLPGNDVVGFEARLRWQHPREGWLTPDLFIPLAEKSGLILPLGNWILTEALRQFRQFRRLHPAPELRLSVNISPLQLLHQGFCVDLVGMLQSAGFPASSLCLEVTEGVLADVAAAYVIAELRNIGVHVALDDFGMGYLSLSRLRQLPVDIVKLDRSFLEPSEAGSDVSSFIEAVINLVHAAGHLVVAKGIETPAQLNTVTAAGADNVQGFLLAPPLPANAATALLAKPSPTFPPVSGV